MHNVTTEYKWHGSYLLLTFLSKLIGKERLLQVRASRPENTDQTNMFGTHVGLLGECLPVHFGLFTLSILFLEKCKH